MIEDWQEIADDYEGGGLVLGNGASIAVDPAFDYRSLREEAASDLPEDVTGLFRAFDTEDFELILRLLWHASIVNEHLEIRDRRTTEAYEAVRSALIETVRAKHISPADAGPYFGSMVGFLGHFSRVASLNYDLLVYWAMMAANANDPNRFKDCFVLGAFERDWEYLADPYPGNDAATLIFYPHGNLCLAADVFGEEHKIHAHDHAQLLDTVVGAWMTGDATPLFVAEGTTEQKQAAITRSPYLSAVSEDVLPAMGESLVIYGWKMGEQDEHILRAVAEGSVERVAIAVFTEAGDPEEKCRLQKARARSVLGGRTQVVCFDSQSSGAWVADVDAED